MGSEPLESSDCVEFGVVLICTSPRFRRSDCGARASEMEGRAWICMDDETKAPADGRGFRAGLSVGWMGGATDSPRIGSAGQPAKGSILVVARLPPPLTTGSVRITTLPQARIAGHSSARGMPHGARVISPACDFAPHKIRTRTSVPFTIRLGGPRSCLGPPGASHAG